MQARPCAAALRCSAAVAYLRAGAHPRAMSRCTQGHWRPSLLFEGNGGADRDRLSDSRAGPAKSRAEACRAALCGGPVINSTAAPDAVRHRRTPAELARSMASRSSKAAARRRPQPCQDHVVCRRGRWATQGRPARLHRGPWRAGTGNRHRPTMRNHPIRHRAFEAASRPAGPSASYEACPIYRCRERANLYWRPGPMDGRSISRTILGRPTPTPVQHQGL